MAVDKAFILGLPDELLDKILASVVEPLHDTDSNEKSYEPLRALLMICRRFRRLATPYLYSSLRIHFDDERSSNHKQTRKLLHRSLRENPDLWPLCKTLVIKHSSEKSSETSFSDMYIALDLATWLSATRSLRVSNHGNWKPFGERWHPFSQAIRHMPRLVELEVCDFDYRDISLPTIIDDLGYLSNGSSLRKLQLSGVSTLSNSQAWGKLQGLAGTGSLTELELFGFLQTTEVLAHLLAWPAKLEVFKFRFSYSPHYDSDGLSTDWSLGTFRRVLMPQAQSLRTIEIRNINKTGLHGFVLSAFSRLEHLLLSHGSTGTDSSLISNLIAPNLRSFHWDLTLEDQQCGETLDNFGQEEEDWLRALVDAAIKGKSRLGEIRVTFTPEEWVRDFNPNNKPVYPWDRMDAIAREIEPHGLALRYNTPTTTREQFEALFKEGRPDEGLTPLWWALDTGQADFMMQLLVEGADIEMVRYGRTPLREAAEMGFPSFVEILLDFGAFVDAVDDCGKTPLWIAAELGNARVVKLLLEKGADTEIPDDDEGQTPLLRAAFLGHFGVVELLLDYDAEFDVKDDLHGNTPLIWAAAHGHARVVNELLKRGADATVTDRRYGRTALQWAREAGYDSVIRVFDDYEGLE